MLALADIDGNGTMAVTAGPATTNAPAVIVSAITERVLLDQAPQLTKSALMRVYVLSVMGIVSLVGNLGTIWNICKTRQTRRLSRHSWSAIYFLILHLSIADVLVTCFCIFGEAGWSYTVQWVAGELACKMVKLAQMFSLYLSTYVLVLIGVDRWIAVKYPMKSLNMAKRCQRLLQYAYLMSFVLSVPQVSYRRPMAGDHASPIYPNSLSSVINESWLSTRECQNTSTYFINNLPFDVISSAA